MGGRQVCFFCIYFSSRFSFLFLKPSFPLFVVLSFLLRTTLAQPQALHVCIDEAKTVFTGRLGTFSVRWDAEGTTPLK